MEIIAEIGQNFNGDINLAIQLILKAKESGADVAKFQLYNAKSCLVKITTLGMSTIVRLRLLTIMLKF
jgi:sialic acid synthase SpsE